MNIHHRRVSGLFVLAAVVSVSVWPLLAPSATAAPASAAQAVERPGWHAMPLTDATSGQIFNLADFDGKTVYVEPMATWCTNCRNQMRVIRDEVRAQVDPEQVVFVGLSVETNLDSATLAEYTATHGFDWTFAVMTPELLQELAATFGRTVTNPPAVPHFVIGPDGTVSDLGTGHHSAEHLLERLAATGAMTHP